MLEVKPDKPRLTPRQRDVLEKMSQGWELRWAYGGGFRLSNDENATSVVGHQTVSALREAGVISRDKQRHDLAYRLTPAGIEALKEPT